MVNLGDRSKYLGASDMGYIMRGDWYPLWLQKTGREAFPDLTDVLAVQLGINTEALNIAWFCKQKDKQQDPYAPAQWTHKEHEFIKCHPDAVLQGMELVEAKFCGAFVKEDELVQRYYPQVQAQLAITGASLCHLSVITGSPSWYTHPIPPDPEYIGELVKQACQFWNYVKSDTPPPDQPAASAKIELDQMREVSMEGKNEWASHAADWIETKTAAKKFEGAVKGIKGLVEADVKKACGHGIEASRNKAGSISIKELRA